MVIETQGMAQTQERLTRLPQVIQQTQQREIHALGARYLETLKAETPEGQGKLRQAYEVQESYSAAEASYRIANAAPYLHFVINGRGPIVASGRALRFEIDGVVYFRKRVGPAAPNPFPERAARAMAPYVAATRAALPGLIVRNYGTS